MLSFASVIDLKGEEMAEDATGIGNLGRKILELETTDQVIHLRTTITEAMATTRHQTGL